MIRKTILLIILAFLISAALPSSAASENQDLSETHVSSQTQVSNTTVKTGNVQTKVKINSNTGYNQAVNQQTRTQVDIETQGDATASVQIRNRSTNEHTSQVAEQVQLLLENPDRQGGIGEEVRQIAREQVHAQATISSQLQQLQSRNQLVTRFFGPNYKAINALEGMMLQNQIRIQELIALKDEVVNPTDLTELEDTIVTLEDQNRTLASEIATAKSTKSLFGWLVRLFIR